MDREWMNEACDSIRRKEGGECQCAGLEAGILRGLEMARECIERWGSDGLDALDDLIAKHKEGK